MKLRFPSEWGERLPFMGENVRGVRYGPLDAEWVEFVPSWLDQARIEGGQDLRAARVFRCGDLVAKFFHDSSSLTRILRPPGSMRAAQMYFRLLPLRSPRPLLAVAGVGSLRHKPSLLLSEFVAGPLLSEAWQTDEQARRALPHFLTDMHRHGIYHGDLHPGNLVWSESGWVLLDLTAIRQGLHRLFNRRRIILGQWARLIVYLEDPGGVEEAFRAYVANGSLRGNTGQLWQHIVERARSFDRNRRAS